MAHDLDLDSRTIDFPFQYVGLETGPFRDETTNYGWASENGQVADPIGKPMISSGYGKCGQTIDCGRDERSSSADCVIAEGKFLHRDLHRYCG